MKRRASFLFTSAWFIMALAGWLVFAAPTVWAQQQPAPAASQGLFDERIIRLEQRILNLQTVIGTLQTFVRDGGGVRGPSAGGEGVASGGAPSEISIRVLALETQIKALTTQMEQIVTRLDQGNPGAGVPGFSTNTVAPSTQNPFSDPGSVPQAQSDQQSPQSRAGLQLPSQPFPQPVVPGAGGGSRAVYDASYKSFLRNDLPRAVSGFQHFVKSFPDDQLISNAYYWLGRTHYARRQYEPAAKAFLSGYKKDKKNPIAPDALLHLGMSLGAMGEKEAACSTLGAISKQFPNAPATLKQGVGEQLKSVGCEG